MTETRITQDKGIHSFQQLLLLNKDMGYTLDILKYLGYQSHKSARRKILSQQTILGLWSLKIWVALCSMYLSGWLRFIDDWYRHVVTSRPSSPNTTISLAESSHKCPRSFNMLWYPWEGHNVCHHKWLGLWIPDPIPYHWPDPRPQPICLVILTIKIPM